MTIKSKIIERLDKLGLKPSKGLGQHFLIENAAYQKIVAAGQIERGEVVLEVGPGLGTLTEVLLEAGAEVIAVEKDRKLISFLESEFKEKNIKIIEGDILEMNPKELGLQDRGYKVIANIPYYITSKLLRNIFELWPQPKLLVLLVQHEVAHRIMAKPPHLNILAISVQYYAKPKIISKVSRQSFSPPPDVDSAIIQLTSTDKKPDREAEKRFFRVVRMGFSSKRKKLANNLSAGLKIDKKLTEKILSEAGIGLDSRPENLTIDQWQKIAEIVHNLPLPSQ